MKDSSSWKMNETHGLLRAMERLDVDDGGAREIVKRVRESGKFVRKREKQLARLTDPVEQARQRARIYRYDEETDHVFIFNERRGWLVTVMPWSRTKWEHPRSVIARDPVLPELGEDEDV